METGIRKTLEGYQVWFKIDNQTFYLDEHVENTDKDSLEVAQFFERMLKVAFEKLDIHDVSKPVVCGNCDGWGYTVDENGRRKQHCKECE
tara:strand:+ start:339 stop:608 length:270 start_codon:yes stop_codon:yes gene_type:complete